MKLAEALAEESVKDEAYIKLLPKCDKIYKMLLPVFDCASITRCGGLDGSKPSNREIFQMHYKSLRGDFPDGAGPLGNEKGVHKLSEAIVFFCLLVDDALEGWQSDRRTGSIDQSGFTRSERRKIAKNARKLVADVWWGWECAHEGEEFVAGDTRAEVVKMARSVSFIRATGTLRTRAKMEGRGIFSGKWEWVINGRKMALERGAGTSVRPG